MAEIIGVKFQDNGKIYFFDASDLSTRTGEHVIVETIRGIEYGEVAMGKHFRSDQTLAAPLKKVIRIANEQDDKHAIQIKQHEKEAFAICQKKINDHKLEMKLVSVEATFDNSKLLFYFTANGRVDFRSLVKDLASVFKTRIELRQIGVRDEAKMLGGLGPCGRGICCGTFLGDFEPVSIKMAKEQNLSLNPTKISGVCGRLMCCLKYEQEDYEQTRKRMPRVGKQVVTPDGVGTVTDLNIVKETVKVRISKGDSFEINEYDLNLIQRPGQLESNTDNSIVETYEETENNFEYEQNYNQALNSVKLNSNSSEHNEEQGRDAVKTNIIVEKKAKVDLHKKTEVQDNNQLGRPVKRENREKNINQRRKHSPNDDTKLVHHEQKTVSENQNNATELNASDKTKNIWQAQLQKALKQAGEK